MDRKCYNTYNIPRALIVGDSITYVNERGRRIIPKGKKLTKEIIRSTESLQKCIKELHDDIRNQDNQPSHLHDEVKSLQDETSAFLDKLKRSK